MQLSHIIDKTEIRLANVCTIFQVSSNVYSFLEFKFERLNNGLDALAMHWICLDKKDNIVKR